MKTVMMIGTLIAASSAIVEAFAHNVSAMIWAAVAAIWAFNRWLAYHEADREDES